MYLKNIEVHGFKSFAQKINFEFHNGITGIVGPNGCGKSNVGDAVRWVLGEQSARQLRGGNMQDVIFSGTEMRKPLSFASVAITLDNTDHQLPVDYNEVTVTRRLYRSGESEYLINGSICRLKDIQEMFYDTGIGKEGYSIIGQGQIDKILSGKPEDRRELFDEAAGIVKFKRRKNTTLKKLEEERQNLVRVTDILGELEKQLLPLEAQSETAKIYLAKRDALREMDVNLFLQEQEHTDLLLQQLQEKNQTVSSDLRETQEAYEKTKQEYERLEKVLEELTQQMEFLRGELMENALKQQQYEGKVQVFSEQISSGNQNEEHYALRLQVLEKEISQKQEERKRLQKEKAELHRQLQAVQIKKKQEEAKMQEIASSIEECSQVLENSKNEIIEILNNRATTKGKVQRFDTMTEQVEIHRAQISQKMLHLKSEEEEQKSVRRKEQEQYDAVSSSIEAMNAESVRLDEEVHRLQKELKKQNRKLDEEQAAYHKEASRLESLKNIAERYDGYGNSIKRVMEQKESDSGIKGVVADLIQVEKEYELAVETALGGNIQNIVTDNEQTAKRMIGFLKKHRFGRATFLPLNHISEKNDFPQKDALKEKGVIGIAGDLVQTEPEYELLVKDLLGRVLIVDDMDHAIVIAKKYKHSFRMVTLEGDSLNPGGSMTGGAFKNNSNLLGRRREIEELEQLVHKRKVELENLRESISENRSQRNVLRSTIADIQEQLRKQYLAQNTARMSLARLDDKLEEIRKSYLQIQKEQEEIQRQDVEIRRNYSQIEKELEESKRDEKELEDFIETRHQELEEWKNEEAAKMKELESIRLESAALEQQESFHSENLTRLETELGTHQKEKAGILEILVQSKSEIEKKAEDIVKLQDEILSLKKYAEEGSLRLQIWQQEKEQQNAVYKNFFEKRDFLLNRIHLLDKECFRLKSQIEKLEEEKEAQISYMWAEYELTPNHALSYRKEEMPDRSHLKKEIIRIKEEIRRLGAVNVNAIEEYKNLRERHTFLSEQYQDLVTAEKTLMNIVQELEDGMRRQFSEKFAEIQQEFNKTFKELFGGGKGTLELDSEADILDAGIRIISQPPGKKLQNMMQLSGGEKALTAIALLFAIQNLKPSPFCLLDEIEAALDDSNVSRFAGYLQKLTKNTQFIIITHRRGTMSAADRLYGITMQEKGVSTLVSVDLVENQLNK